MLHHDHHLEHHIYPRLNWYELPEVRARLALKPGLELHRVTLPQFFTEVFLRGPDWLVLSRRSITRSAATPVFARPRIVSRQGSRVRIPTSQAAPAAPQSCSA